MVSGPPAGAGDGRDLEAELLAERASTDHWRRVARQRSAAYDDLKHRPSVRALLALDRYTAPLRRSRARSGRRAREVIDRLGVALRAAPGRRQSAGRRAQLVAQLHALPSPSDLDRSLSVVVVCEAAKRSRPIGLEVATEVILVTPPGSEPWGPDAAGRTVSPAPGESPGALVRRAIDLAEGELVCLLSSAIEPLDDRWLARLAEAVRDGVAAAAPVLVHPEGRLAGPTPHPLLVREAGLALVLGDEDDPLVEALGEGDRPDPTSPPADVAAASAACLLVDRRAHDEAGGWPSTDGLDLGAIELCARLRHGGGRVVTVPGAMVLDHRPVPSLRALRAPIPPDSRAWRATIERQGPLLFRAASPVPPGTLRVAMTVASPSAKVAARWGDWHLANGLADGIRRRGHHVRVQTADLADHPAGRACDIHLVLRGLQPVRRTPGQGHVLWVISHPESIEDAELDEADLVLVASPIYAQHLRTRTTTPVEVLLQATDHRRFRPQPPDARHQHPITVVAKTRDVLRPIVADALAAGLRPSIYGGGWRSLVDPGLVVADHVPNEALPTVYSSAGVVLNDHWPTMRAWGFVSNRIFDVLACGTPIISDAVPGLDELLEGAVITYRTPQELLACVTEVLGDPKRAKARAERGRRVVVRAHTFDNRATEFLAAVNRYALRPDGHRQ